MKYRKRAIVNICLIVAVLGAWLWMFAQGDGLLADRGIKSLRYFTVLSNLMVAIAAAAWLVSVRRHGKPGAGAERFKYAAATSVALTFTVVMGFLGPLYGYGMMLSGGNLFLHLLIPLAAMAEVIFLSDMEFDRRDNLIAVIPAALYGVFYFLNNLINGTGEWPDTNDWYLFLAWGWPIGICIFIVSGLVTWLLALLIRKLQRLYIRSCKEAKR